jgi:Fur family ferric uptake transcriptional regulator
MIASTQTNAPLTGVPTKTALAVATTRLKAAGLRITQPRLTILAALIKQGRPTSIEAIHDELSRGSCDLVTVYRCMAAFEEIGIVRRTYFHNGTGLYSLRLDDAPHYHVVSRSTGTVDELDAETARELNAALTAVEEKLRARGYTGVSHLAEFFGTPPATARSQNEQPLPAVR